MTRWIPDANGIGVEKISAWIPVTDEDIVDFHIGTEEQQAAAQARIDRDRRKMDRWWRRIPWYIRAYRVARGKFVGWIE